jgi:hypothetical protein
MYDLVARIHLYLILQLSSIKVAIYEYLKLQFGEI